LILAEHFLEQFGRQSGRVQVRLSSGVRDRLLEYDWPGNVRELSNCIERALALSPEEEIRVSDLPDELRNPPTRGNTPEPDQTALLPLSEIEKRYILRVLEIVGGNKTAAARVLQLDRRTLYRKLKIYEGKHPKIIERTASGRHRRRDLFVPRS
jgi:two-component system response regulator HydG